MTVGADLLAQLAQDIADASDPTTRTKPRLGQITALNYTTTPPTLTVDGRLMRYLGATSQYVVGDTAMWLPFGDTPVVIGSMRNLGAARMDNASGAFIANPTGFRPRQTWMGTTVVTTNTNGDIGVTFPASFLESFFTVIIQGGDALSDAATIWFPHSYTLGTFQARAVLCSTATARGSFGPVRVNFIAGGA